MASYSYTGTLTNIGLGVLTGSYPVMRVRPEVESFGPDGLVSAIPVAVSLMPATGAFAMSLVPSGELTPVAGGSPGVDYIIEVGRFEQAIDGTYFSGLDAWQFAAVAGGGNVGGMSGGSLLATWLGPPWPEKPYPKGLYIDMTEDNEWTLVT